MEHRWTLPLLLCPLLLAGCLSPAGVRSEAAEKTGTRALTRLLLLVLSELRAERGCGRGAVDDLKGTARARGGRQCNARNPCHTSCQPKPEVAEARRMSEARECRGRGKGPRCISCRTERAPKAPKKSNRELPKELTAPVLTTTSALAGIDCAAYCVPSSGRMKMDLKEFCNRPYVLHVRVSDSLRLGSWWRLRVSVRAVYRPSLRAGWGGRQHLWVPDRELACGCLSLRSGVSYLLLAAPGAGNGGGGGRLTAGRGSDSLPWRRSWGPRLRRLRLAESKGGCLGPRATPSVRPTPSDAPGTPLDPTSPPEAHPARSDSPAPSGLPWRPQGRYGQQPGPSSPPGTAAGQCGPPSAPSSSPSSPPGAAPSNCPFQTQPATSRHSRDLS